MIALPTILSSKEERQSNIRKTHMNAWMGKSQKKEHECTDAACGSCKLEETSTMTSAEFEAEMAKYTTPGCKLVGEDEQATPPQKWYATVTVISGAPPANPCTPEASHGVSSRLHKAVACVALLSGVFALQQKA
eukprot:gnl/TRDRNA2_/TRDRNA2_176415_c0_seq1.p1 gnl/TRDRNA2_/TRDRNA2_176415_c0~~gnl/TRDRNA2_/TRDRNA2_176415_c0_seq1.p1  ORF type:complete len:134 (+),score=19.78 gnl/TRDRNA2_/TRDRNA2_176415_c0_seq1:181-582(+)